VFFFRCNKISDEADRFPDAEADPARAMAGVSGYVAFGAACTMTAAFPNTNW
jgi:hypothetical protein